MMSNSRSMIIKRGSIFFQHEGMMLKWNSIQIIERWKWAYHLAYESLHVLAVTTVQTDTFLHLSTRFQRNNKSITTT